MTRNLHLSFLDSNYHKHTEVFANYQGDLSVEAIHDFMEQMVSYDMPRKKDGVYQCAHILAAKIVTVEEEVLFDHSDQFPKKTTPKPLPDQLEKLNKPTPEPQTEMTLAQMGRYSATKVQKIVTSDLTLNDYDADSAERCLKNVLRSQLLNKLLPRGKKLVPQLFMPVMKDLYQKSSWTPLLISYLDKVADFFAPMDWLRLMEDYQKNGREATAKMMAKDGVPNYKEAKLYMGQMLGAARHRFRDYQQKFKESQEQLARLLC